jgi:D-beta-D-heptose 7-phosphate kinase/D-beta-D-heptose 1-phosphate adenosyltransferase
MRQSRVVVAGDVMLDAFVFGKVVRISPEAPVPVVQVQEETERLGGAANVALNVVSLGGSASLVGVVGDDPAGARVGAELKRAGIESRLIVAATRPTTVKTRIVAHHQQLVRADREVTAPVDGAGLARTVLATTEALLPGSALVISDYDKGVVTEPFARSVIAAARERNIPVLVDPKVRNIALFSGATLVTPNRVEAEQISGMGIETDEDAERAIRRVVDAAGSSGALVTRGEHGMSLGVKTPSSGPRQRASDGFEFAHVRATAREVYDVTGAGDTAIATLALALVAGASASEAMALANLAAGIAVGKLGTATVSPTEIPGALALSGVAPSPLAPALVSASAAASTSGMPRARPRTGRTS